MAEESLQPGKSMDGDINIVDRLLAPGLNLLVLPKEQREQCFGMSFPLFMGITILLRQFGN